MRRRCMFLLFTPPFKRWIFVTPGKLSADFREQLLHFAPQGGQIMLPRLASRRAAPKLTSLLITTKSTITLKSTSALVEAT